LASPMRPAASAARLRTAASLCSRSAIRGSPKVRESSALSIVTWTSSGTCAVTPTSAPTISDAIRKIFIILARLSRRGFHLDYLETRCHLGGRAYGRGDGTILLFRELYSVGKGIFRDGTPAHDMVNVKRDKLPRIVAYAFARHFETIFFQRLALFFHYRNDVGGGACRDRH